MLRLAAVFGRRPVDGGQPERHAEWMQSNSLGLVIGLVILSILGGHSSSTATEIIGKEVKAVHAVAVDAITGLNLSDDEWTDLPGAATTVKVPAGPQALIIGRWSGVSNPFPQNNSGLHVRIVVGTEQAQPADDGVYYGTHIAIERSLGPVAKGSYLVKVQVRLAPCGGCTQDTNFSGSHFTVERISF